jgi:hypothetical protein
VCKLVCHKEDVETLAYFLKCCASDVVPHAVGHPFSRSSIIKQFPLWPTQINHLPTQPAESIAKIIVPLQFLNRGMEKHCFRCLVADDVRQLVQDNAGNLQQLNVNNDGATAAL